MFVMRLLLHTKDSWEQGEGESLVPYINRMRNRSKPLCNTFRSMPNAVIHGISHNNRVFIYSHHCALAHKTYQFSNTKIDNKSSTQTRDNQTI